jgi:hypothetical protein
MDNKALRESNVRLNAHLRDLDAVSINLNEEWTTYVGKLSKASAAGVAQMEHDFQFASQ